MAENKTTDGGCQSEKVNASSPTAAYPGNGTAASDKQAEAGVATATHTTPGTKKSRYLRVSSPPTGQMRRIPPVRKRCWARAIPA